jgi:hypothetical protein
LIARRSDETKCGPCNPEFCRRIGGARRVLRYAVASNPGESSALLGDRRCVASAIIGITALVIINGPIKRGERWARWTLLILIGLSEGINASQMWRFGSPYYFPVAFIALSVIGLATLPTNTTSKIKN